LGVHGWGKMWRTKPEACDNGRKKSLSGKYKEISPQTPCTFLHNVSVQGYISLGKIYFWSKMEALSSLFFLFNCFLESTEKIKKVKHREGKLNHNVRHWRQP
jgi:hypothetical protein